MYGFEVAAMICLALAATYVILLLGVLEEINLQDGPTCPRCSTVSDSFSHVGDNGEDIDICPHCQYVWSPGD